MAYIKLSEKTDTGNGFITHEDWKTLSFEGHGNIFKVTGADKGVLAWAKRVGGSVMAESDALATLKVAQWDAVKREIAETESKLTELKAIKTTLEKVT